MGRGEGRGWGWGREGGNELVHGLVRWFKVEEWLTCGNGVGSQVPDGKCRHSGIRGVWPQLKLHLLQTLTL